MRIGLADHLGWTVAVAADDDHHVIDRRRIELVDGGLSQAPIHYDRGQSSPAETAARIAEVEASVQRVGGAALDELADALAGPVTSLSLRTWPDDFPTDLEVLVRPPWEARADAVMYRRILAELAADRGWAVHRYDARTVVDDAAAVLGDRSAEVLDGPRARLGPPWTKDHRMALAATVVATGDRGDST